MKVKSLHAAVAAAFVLTACGGGGGDGPQVGSGNGTGGTTIGPGTGGGATVTPQPLPTPPTPVVKDATLRMQGGVIDVAAGETNSVSLAVECPRISPGSTRCAKIVGPVTLTIVAASVPIDKISLSYNERVVNQGVPLNFDEAGTFKISFTLGLAAMVGQPGPIAVSATTNGLATVEVVGTPTMLRVTHEAAKLQNASSATFSKVGYGEMAGFDVTCPQDTAPQGCLVKGMAQMLTLNGAAVAPRQQVDTYIGTTFWWQYDTLVGTTSYPMNNGGAVKVAAGTSVRISARSSMTQGTLVLTNFEFVRAADGTPIPVILPANACQTILAGFGCKG